MRDGRAVAARGCNTHAQRAAAQGARPRRPARHGLLGGSPVTPCQRTGADRGHKRRIVGPPQGSRSRPANTARGAPKVRRTCGLFPDCLGAARGRGPRVRMDPGVPRALAFRARTGTRRGIPAHPAPAKEYGSEKHVLSAAIKFTLPLAGRVASTRSSELRRAEKFRTRASRVGVDVLEKLRAKQQPPTPDPSPQGGGEKNFRRRQKNTGR
jgi:hypothetical protein